MKSLNYLVPYVLHYMESMLSVDASADLKTVNTRLKTEGSSFLTITLANFGKDFEKSLDQGFVAPGAFAGFSRHAGLPRFLGGFLELVFDRITGALLDDPSIGAIQCIRQFSLMWAKVETKPSEKRIESAFRKYLQREQIVREGDQKLDPSRLDRFSQIGTMLWGNLLAALDKRVYEMDLTPRHGPGSTADHVLGNAKWRQYVWTERLEEVFPCGRFLFPNYRSFLEQDVHYLEPGTEIPVEVIWVPKTQKTPRIIAMEPVHMQYMQQALFAAIQEELESYGSDAFIHFEDQIPNQEMAKQGSFDGSLATLDLSEASDSVSYQHVRALLRNFPHLSAGIDACRSRKASVPDHGVIRLAKFASMGSAVCFPMEALVFSTLVFMAIEDSLERRLTLRDLQSLRGSVRVYGDDIIVPTHYAESVVRTLSEFTYSVNVNKSFWNGKFRESCGKDYYAGQDVSYVKVRRELPSDRKQTREIASAVAFRNQMYYLGYWKTVRAMDYLLSKTLRGAYPAVESTSPALGRYSFLPVEGIKMCPNLQVPLVKGLQIVAPAPPSHLDGWAALNKIFLTSKDLPIFDRNHLEFAGRPVSLQLKYGWVPTY
jgi:hypothetical protein